MESNQRGFSVIKIVLAVLVVIVLAAGYGLWRQHHKTVSTKYGSTSLTPTNFNECLELGGTQSPEPSTTTKDNCTLAGKIFNVTSDNVPAAWGHATAKTVHLRKWNATLTVPQSLIGGLYYQVDPSENIYDFTTAEMFAPSCTAYFGQYSQEASVEFDQYPLNKPAKEVIADAGTLSLNDYYNAHKAADGNYVVDAANGRKVWKSGQHFYEILTNTAKYQGDAFVHACPGVTSQYQDELAAAAATLKEN